MTPPINPNPIAATLSEPKPEMKLDLFGVHQDPSAPNDLENEAPVASKAGDAPPQNTLLPCPFCGNKNVDLVYDFGRVAIQCLNINCYIRGPWKHYHDERDNEFGKQAWNQRVAPSVVAGVEEKRWKTIRIEINPPAYDVQTPERCLDTNMEYRDAKAVIDAHNASLGEPRGGSPAAHVLQMACEEAAELLFPRQWNPRIPLKATQHSATNVIRQTVESFTQPIIDFAEWGWTIIANASGGDWEKESKDWQEAAARYRDEFHERIRNYLPSVGASNAVLPHPVSEAQPEEKDSEWTKHFWGMTATEATDSIVEIESEGDERRRSIFDYVMWAIETCCSNPVGSTATGVEDEEIARAATEKIKEAYGLHGCHKVDLFDTILEAIRQKGHAEVVSDEKIAREAAQSYLIQSYSSTDQTNFEREAKLESVIRAALRRKAKSLSEPKELEGEKQ